MIFILVLTVLPLCSLCGAGNAEICNPVQYVERGNAGTIYCSFGEDSHGIYWYDTSDVTEHPMFYWEDNVKSGEGFSSGEFDVHANGSLTMNNVSLSHDHNFTVLQLQTADSNPIVLTIQVVVTVHPTLLYPFISYCNGTRYCYHYAKDSSAVVCFVNKTRPLTQLSWNLRTTNDEHELFFHTESIQDGVLFTSWITVNQSVNYNNFHLLVCKATPGEPTLINEDALVLIELHSPKANFLKAVVENHPINKTIRLPCSINESLFFVWKRRINGTNFKLLAHGSNGSTVCESNQYSLNSKNALFIHFLSRELEGIYVCFYGNGTDEEMSVYNVSISDINDISSAQPRKLLYILMAFLVAIVLLLIGLVVIKQGKTRNCLNGYFSVPTKDNTANKQVDRTSIKACLVEQGTPAIYELNFSKSIKNSDLKMRKCYIGTCSQPRDNKVVLFVGETGAGKTTLINALVNYLLGVKWHDDFRYQLPLIDEEKNRSQQDSQTKWISVYTFYEHSTTLNYDITIIDTPGLGDTSGELRDKEILTQLQGFMLNEIKHFNLIAFVKKATDLRITDRMAYVTKSIKKLFGKDVENSICLLATHASVSDNEKFRNIYKKFGKRDILFFNNEHLYLEKGTNYYEELEPQWEMGWKTFISFTNILSACPNIGIELTREVVKVTKQLEKILSNFQELLKTNVILYNALQAEENALHKSSENKQPVYEYEETYEETVKMNLSDGKMAIVCMDCERTCCNPCYASYVTTCASITPFASIFGCPQCESRCSYLTHFKKDFMFERKICTRTVTKKAIKISENDDNIAQAVNNLQERKNITKAEIVAKIETIRDCIEQINRLSYESAKNTVKQYLKNMITNETSKAESGWKDRVEFLTELASCEK